MKGRKGRDEGNAGSGINKESRAGFNGQRSTKLRPRKRKEGRSRLRKARRMSNASLDTGGLELKIMKMHDGYE